MALVELSPDRIAAGGDAVAREPSGRVVFVRGALPGEQVTARLTDERRDFAKASVVEVRTPSPARVEPPCPYVAAGCGGCGWQHISIDEQRSLKRQIVLDALARVGRIADPVVEAGPSLADLGFRTTVRVGVDPGGHPGFRAARTHDVVPVERCLVAHPALDDLLATAHFPGADEVLLRCSAATGARVAVVDPPQAAVAAVLPDDVEVGSSAVIEEEVAGRRLQVSASSFFQARPDGATALVHTVAAAAGDHLAADTVVDAYAGVGVFGACLPLTGRVVAIESSRSACADAAVNLAERDAQILRLDVARWLPCPAGLVVADPPRVGLRAAGARALAAAGAPRLVLVSCDPVAMARDAGLLAGLGYRHRRSVVVDLFPHTPHVEVVTRFDRDGDGGGG